LERTPAAPLDGLTGELRRTLSRRLTRPRQRDRRPLGNPAALV